MIIPEFRSKKIRDLVFTHRSYLNESRDVEESNERLEFLGDSILSFVVSSHIFNTYPGNNEGELTSIRSVLTNTQTLYLVAVELALGQELKMSKGEEESGGRNNKSILANTYEAVVGGLFIDRGIEASREFIANTILSKIDYFLDQQGMKDPKSKLQEYMQEKHKVSPDYEILEDFGPDHSKKYIAGVFQEKRLLAKGEGKSKQEAEKDAAQKAIEALDI